MANTEIIPVIDLGPYLAGAAGAIDRTAEELRFALTEIGFYFMVNHGVPSEQIQAVFRQAARFHACRSKRSWRSGSTGTMSATYQ
jgi:isopenicillin N synthase-like dioxygenase